MTSKVIWDFSIYWGVNALIFFHNKSQDLAFWTAIRQDLTRFDKLNVRMQQFFRDWDVLQQEPNGSSTTVAGLTDWAPTFVNYMKIPYLHELHTELTAGLDEAALKARVIENIDLLEVVADEMYQQARRTTPRAAELHYPVETGVENGLHGMHAGNGATQENGNGYIAARQQTYSSGRTSGEVRAELRRIWLATQSREIDELHPAARQQNGMGVGSAQGQAVKELA
jgi:hypothetical protein